MFQCFQYLHIYKEVSREHIRVTKFADVVSEQKDIFDSF